MDVSGNAQIEIVQHRLSVISEVKAAELDFARYGQVAGLSGIPYFGLFHQDFIDAYHRRRAPLENVDYPAQGDHREGKLHHVNVKRGETADFHMAQ